MEGTHTFIINPIRPSADRPGFLAQSDWSLSCDHGLDYAS